MNIWAHRGASYQYPENTLAAFREAIQYDITGVELDIQLTKDGYMVVIHDETVDRTMEGTGAVKDYTLEEIQKLAPRNRELAEAPAEWERIPTIEEVFQLLADPCKSRGFLINIELKNSVERYEGMEEKILQTVHSYGLADYVIYSSFFPESMALLKELDPTVHTGVLAADVSTCLSDAEKSGADAVHPHVDHIDVPHLSLKTTKPVRAWTAGYEPFFCDRRDVSVPKKDRENAGVEAAVSKSEPGAAADKNTDEIRRVDIGAARRNGVTDIFTNVPERYVKKLGEDGVEAVFFPYKSVNKENGRLVDVKELLAVNWEPVPVYPGTKLIWKDEKASCQVFFYTSDIDDRWIHTYSYDPESNWGSYDRERSRTDWSSEDIVFEESGFIRIVVRLGDEPSAAAPFEISQPPIPGALTADYLQKHPEAEVFYRSAACPSIRPCFLRETEAVGERLKNIRQPGDTVFFLFADSHYVINGNWEETAKNTQLSAKRMTPDLLIHLGDFTDGLLPEVLTKQYSGRILGPLRDTGIPLLCCVGNHDTNYFRGNRDRMDKKACIEWYLGQAEGEDLSGAGEGSGTRSVFRKLLGGDPKKTSSGTSGRALRESYYVDISEKKLRFIFLASFDSKRKEPGRRYGYSLSDSMWLGKTLQATPKDCGILVFSHVPILGKMHVWSNGIRGSKRILYIMEQHQAVHHNILAFIHGHNHADQVNTQFSFPIVAVGCQKLESFPEKKPKGSVCYDRMRDDVTQDLWDIVRVSADKTRIDFLRFGAGEDRHLERAGRGKEWKLTEE